MLPVARLDAAPASVLPPRPVGRLPLDGGRLDAALGGGLALAGCHELHGTAADALAMMLALACPRPGPILWLAAGRSDDGRIYGAGIAELGGDPGRLWLVAAPDAIAMLRAAGEAQRCAALSCVVIEAGSSAAIDLTTSRRLQLAAAAHGVFTLLLRAGPARPSAALTRWQVQPAPARRLAAAAPGPPCLALTLARQRGGPADISATLEWDRDRRRFLPAANAGGRILPFVPIGIAFGRRPPHPGAGAAVAGRRTPGPGSSRAA